MVFGLRRRAGEDPRGEVGSEGRRRPRRPTGSQGPVPGLDHHRQHDRIFGGVMASAASSAKPAQAASAGLKPSVTLPARPSSTQFVQSEPLMATKMRSGWRAARQWPRRPPPAPTRPPASALSDLLRQSPRRPGHRHTPVGVTPVATSASHPSAAAATTSIAGGVKG